MREWVVTYKQEKEIAPDVILGANREGDGGGKSMNLFMNSSLVKQYNYLAIRNLNSSFHSFLNYYQSSTIWYNLDDIDKKKIIFVNSNFNDFSTSSSFFYTSQTFLFYVVFICSSVYVIYHHRMFHTIKEQTK